jgi:hypothetical protein
VIPTSVFFMLVVMAVVTTYMTSPVMRRLVRNTELEQYFEQSIFMQRDRDRRHSLSGPA